MKNKTSKKCIIMVLVAGISEKINLVEEINRMTQSDPRERYQLVNAYWQ